MAKTGTQYAQEVRELRAAGFNFPASSGYKLASPAQWSSGQKAAVTREFNRLQFQESVGIDDSTPAQGVEPDRDFAPDGISDELAEEFFEDAAGDEFEEWDDIDFFDFDEAEEFQDEEGDSYEEVT